MRDKRIYSENQKEYNCRMVFYAFFTKEKDYFSYQNLQKIHHNHHALHTHYSCTGVARISQYKKVFCDNAFWLFCIQNIVEMAYVVVYNHDIIYPLLRKNI